MARVEIYKINNDGTQNIVGICRLDKSGIVMCEGDPTIIASLEKNGIFDYTSEKRKILRFSDGMMFLEQLKFNLKSGYLNASDVLT